MKAEPLMRERRVLRSGFIEVIVWRLPEPLSGSVHSLKYRLAYVVEGECVLRRDRHDDRHHNRHVGTKEMPYVFVSIDQLLHDFSADIATWKGE